MMRNKTAIIILAAGNSSRLGKAKQLLNFNNKSLLRHTLDEALTICQNVIVVLGEENNDIVREIGDTCYIRNNNWDSGMASSITKGLSEVLSRHPETEQFIFSVCDQPYISSVVFEQLIKKKKQSLKNIVASTYENVMGTPVLFSRKYTSHLLNLNGHEGAKKLIKDHLNDVETISFEKGAIDIDTPEDYEKLMDR